ncbi:hypothetical protein [Acetobacter oeni]|uniref:Uncharacterized protein n=1 Tax=Acetobacter oeni TaxID=304077 RepID=A0A511XMS6_9PROT|nr:hypothetical protein [Acetobacter oeni]MBB3884128.1 hypothetical protein [Acetobacter oeni]NHO20130.1 hypothetical protein [Acetobacter oeni]GBR04331.1 hypothetical protein AA21952_1390 [Acetobacter oeni LMG 21952]GEN64226.1 hypothetical protein AOE01nite_24500 [Acetobacter oeni]
MTSIRILPVGHFGINYGLEQFAGLVPNIEDTIVDPGVTDGQDRDMLQNRPRLLVPGPKFRSLRTSISPESRP